MYARISELVLAGWLLAAAWLFAGDADRSPPIMFEVLVAVCLGAITLVAWLAPWSWFRLLNLGVAGALAVAAYVGAIGSGVPAEALYQNRLIVACLLIMFSLVPTRAWHMPRTWEDVLRPSGGPDRGRGET